MRKNVAGQSISIGMIHKTTGDPVTTGTPVVDIVIDNGVPIVGAGTKTHKINGSWSYLPTQAETNGTHIVFIMSLTNAITRELNVYTGTQQSADNDTKISLIPTTAMRGSDNVPTNPALDTDYTAARAVKLDNLDALISSLATLANQTNIQGRLPATLQNGRMQSNVDAIADDVTSPSNLNLQFNGTGIAGDTFPSTQNQLSSIANVGSATHKPTSGYVLTTGTQTANLFSDTEALNAVRHTHADVAGVLDLYYQFTIGSGIPASIQVTGFLNSNNDDVDVYGFDWVSSTWKQIGNVPGSNGSTNVVGSFDMFVDMVGSGANKGLVRARFFKASGLSNASLAIDQIFVAFTIGLDGYEGGAVWCDDQASNIGTEVGIDGTSRNPVSTAAAVESLLVSTGQHRVHVAPGSTLTLATDYSNREVFGEEWFLGLGGQTVNGAHFSGCEATGIGVGTIRCSFHNGSIGIASLPLCDLFNCLHSGKLTLTSAGTYNFYNSSHATDTGPFQLEFGATLGSTIVHAHGYEGAITVANMGTVGTDELHLTGNGKAIFEASCVTGGTANVFGFEIGGVGGVGFTLNTSGNVNTQITDVQSKIGTPAGASVSADIAEIKTFLDTEIADILLDTSTTLDGKLNLIKSITDQFVFTLANVVDSNAKAINDSTEAADDMKTAAETMVKGSAATGTLSTTEMTTNLTISVAGQYNDAVLIFAKDTITPALRGQRTDITATTILNGKLGFTALTTAPANGDTFIVV